MNGSSEVTASDRVHITDGGSNLTISVTRYDQAPFRCHVFNPVSNGTSDPVNLTISCEYTSVTIYHNFSMCNPSIAAVCCSSPTCLSDGPDNMALIVNERSTASFSVGTNLTMLCSAQSGPPAQFQWAVRGELVNTTGPLLELFSVTEEQSGSYSCLAFNNHTNMSSNVTKYIMIAGEFICLLISASVFQYLVLILTLLCLYRVFRI